LISIIICSINLDLLQALEDNIASTIGVPYQLISTDNRVEENGICDVYNKAASLAIYPIICFIHEDIKIHTINWGENLIAIFKNTEIGLVGVSGSIYKSSYAGTWPCCTPDLYRVNTIQRYKNKSPIYHTTKQFLDYEEVAVLDGVFLATTMLVFKKYNFDFNLLKDFHGYDIDISVAIGQQYKIVVTYNLLLEHYSEGSLNNSWLLNSMIVHEKWKHLLPIAIGDIPDFMKKESDYASITCLLNTMLLYNGYRGRVFLLYFEIIFKYFKYNMFKYTKTIFLYMVKLSYL